MTVYIEKPAVNLREELASLRNQGGYQEQQFWIDGLVTNGTFDTDTSGWTGMTWQSGGTARVINTGTFVYGRQTISTIAGANYTISADYLGANHTTTVSIRVGTSSGGLDLLNFSFVDTDTGTKTTTFTAAGSTTYIQVLDVSATNGTYTEWDNIRVFETDGTLRMPKGWVPKDVFEDGLLQREGAANDYEVIYDGFDYVVKPTVAPSATTQTCVIGVRK